MKFFIKNKIILLFLIFVFLIILLIVERFLCHANGQNLALYENFYRVQFNHSIYIFLCRDAVLNTLNLWDEGHFVENLQSILLIFSILLLFLSARKLKKENINIHYFLIFQCLGLIYFFGEEKS